MIIALRMEEEYQRWTREISIAKAAIAQGPSDQDESSFDMRYERTYCVPYAAAPVHSPSIQLAKGFFWGVIFSICCLGLIMAAKGGL